MTIFKVEGQGVFIFETPSQEYTPERHTSAMFLQTPRTRILMPYLWYNGTMEQRLLGLSASLLAGGVAELLQLLPGPGQPANQSIKECTPILQRGTSL